MHKLHVPQQVRLEETVRGSDADSPSSSPGPRRRPQRRSTGHPGDTPGSTTHASVSGNSKVDYSVYVIKQESAIVAVLMETQLTSHKNFHHALAQVCPNSSVWVGEGSAPFSLAAPWLGLDGLCCTQFSR